MEQSVNSIILRGELQALPEFSHDNHGRRFFRFYLNVPRLSGAVDTLPIIAEERLLQSIDPCGGGMLTVSGQIRSHNYREDGLRRLMIFVYASSIVAEDGPAMNEVVLEGALCRKPNYRRTPLGREICDVMLAVPRAFRRADYLPGILWGRVAQDICDCEVGSRIHINGRLQSRTYNKTTETGNELRTAYEISALTAYICQEE